MKNHHSPYLFLLFIFTITYPKPTSAFSRTPSPSPFSPTSPSPPPTTQPPPPPPLPLPPPPSPPQPLPLPPPPSPPQQLNNIIDALIGAGDFSSWVNIISTANPMVFPLSATLFIPEDNTLDRHHPPIDPFLFPYHIIPQRLTFSDLLLFDVNTRLPTLLPGKSIFITSNSRDNFTMDDTPITHPDIYCTATVAVHGVAAVLDYSVFGGGIPPKARQELDPPSPEGTLASPFMPIGETIGWRSSAACSCTHVNFSFLIFSGVLAFLL